MAEITKLIRLRHRTGEHIRIVKAASCRVNWKQKLHKSNAGLRNCCQAYTVIGSGWCILELFNIKLYVAFTMMLKDALPIL